MAKVRRLAEDLKMPSHSPGCVEGAQWCFRQYIRSKKHDRTMRASFLKKRPRSTKKFEPRRPARAPDLIASCMRLGTVIGGH